MNERSGYSLYERPDFYYYPGYQYDKCRYPDSEEERLKSAHLIFGFGDFNGVRYRVSLDNGVIAHYNPFPYSLFVFVYKDGVAFLLFGDKDGVTNVEAIDFLLVFVLRPCLWHIDSLCASGKKHESKHYEYLIIHNVSR